MVFSRTNLRARWKRTLSLFDLPIKLVTSGPGWVYQDYSRHPVKAIFYPRLLAAGIESGSAFLAGKTVQVRLDICEGVNRRKSIFIPDPYRTVRAGLPLKKPSHLIRREICSESCKNFLEAKIN